MNYTIEPERKNNRGKNLTWRYQVTMMDASGEPYDSEWVGTKSEAIEMTERIFKNPRHSDVDHCMVFNTLNNKLSFRVNRER